MHPIAIFGVLFLVVVGTSHGAGISKVNPLKRIIQLDPRYLVEIEVDLEATRITFGVSVQTTGYVGLGISPDGIAMWGADIFLGGVNPDGTPYFGDYHGRPGELNEDDEVNWELLEGRENGTHTELIFTRLFNTGDAINDVIITDADTHLIWSIGQTDRPVYHGPNRNGIPINFLAPDFPS